MATVVGWCLVFGPGDWLVFHARGRQGDVSDGFSIGVCFGVGGGGSVELCGRLPAGLTVDWSFTSSVPVASEVHYHEGKQVVHMAKHPSVASIKDQLTVKTEQDYCWMWTNNLRLPFRIEVQLVKAR